MPASTPSISATPAVRTSEESQLIDLFCHYIAPVLWAPTTRQGGEAFPSIVTRLTLCDTATKESTVAMAMCFLAETAHSQLPFRESFILTHYNRAIVGTRQRLTTLTRENTSSNNGRWAILLVNILQFIGLDLFRANVRSATSHLQNFKQILEASRLGNLDVAQGSAIGSFQQLAFRLDLNLKSFPTFEILTRESPVPVDRTFTADEEGPMYLRNKSAVNVSWYYLLADFIHLMHDLPASKMYLASQNNATIESMKSRIQTWISALDFSHATRLETGQTPPDPDETIHKLHSKTMLLRLEAQLKGGVEETSYDELQESFQEILALARSARIYSSQRQNGMWCHASTIASTYFVALKCRDPCLRREAVERMEEWRTWPGLWHGRLLACTVAKRIIQIEESGRVVSCAQDIPETARLRSVSVHIGCSNRCARLTYLAWGNTGRLRQMEELISC